MTGREFIARVRGLGRKRGVAVSFHPERGKGSHGTLFYGGRRTVVKDRRKGLGKGLLGQMLRDLGIDGADL